MVRYHYVKSYLNDFQPLHFELLLIITPLFCQFLSLMIKTHKKIPTLDSYLVIIILNFKQIGIPNLQLAFNYFKLSTLKKLLVRKDNVYVKPWRLCVKRHNTFQSLNIILYSFAPLSLEWRAVLIYPPLQVFVHQFIKTIVANAFFHF